MVCRAIRAIFTAPISPFFYRSMTIKGFQKRSNQDKKDFKYNKYEVYITYNNQQL